jgi:hypothetical protein
MLDLAAVVLLLYPQRLVLRFQRELFLLQLKDFGVGILECCL